MILWKAKTNPSSVYKLMKTPSSYSIETEDLDSNSYRSINTGNLNRTIVSKNWSKLMMSYNYLTFEEAAEILTTISAYPIYIISKNPIFGTEYVEFQCYCSKKRLEMLQDGNYKLSFNLVQSKKVAGQ